MLYSIREFESIISPHIKDTIEEEIYRSIQICPTISPHLKYFKKLSLSKGKRIRAYLVYLGKNLYKNEGKKLSKDLIKACAAMEIFHTAILIHDDIEDQSDLRRGIDTFHKYEERKYESKEIGNGLAINFGDAGLFFSSYIFSEINPEISKLFNKMCLDLSYGQAYDILSTSRTLPDLKFNQIIKICNLKTGLYTFQTPLVIGRILAKCEIKDDVYLNQYSYNAGIVFQLTDDLMEIFSDEETTGKADIHDICSGKITSIIRLTLDLSKGADRKYIENILSGKIKNPKTNEIREIIQNCGALNKINKYIDTYITKAIESIEKVKGDTQSKDVLKKIVISLKNRDH